MPRKPKSLPSKPKSSNSKAARKGKGQETTTKVLPPSLPRDQELISHGIRNIQVRAAVLLKWLTASSSVGAATKMEHHLEMGTTNGLVMTQKNAKVSKVKRT